MSNVTVMEPTASPTTFLDDDDDNDNIVVVTEPEDGFSSRAKTIAVTSKVTGGMSMICSLYLIGYILTNRRRRSLTYQRLIVVLCINDFITSFGYFLSTWPLPVGNNFGAAMDNTDDNEYGSTNPLCTAQGVFLHWGLTTAIANVVLSAHYVLVVRYKFSERVCIICRRKDIIFCIEQTVFSSPLLFVLFIHHYN